MDVASTAELAYEQGMELLSSGCYEEALDAFAHALRSKEDFAAVYFSRAFTYTLLEDYKNAEADYTRAIALDATNPWAYIYRSYTHSAQGHHELALLDCTAALNVNPRLAMAYIERGYAYFKLGKYKESILDFTSFLTLNPRDSSAYFCRAIAYSELAEYGHTVLDLSEAIKCNPKDFSAFFCRGLAYHRLGQLDKATADYKSALSISPDYAHAQYNFDLATRQLEIARANHQRVTRFRAGRERQRVLKLLSRLTRALETSRPRDPSCAQDELKKRIERRLCRTPL
jgi:tetratricopeptide (TPR) repeat protein